MTLDVFIKTSWLDAAQPVCGLVNNEIRFFIRSADYDKTTKLITPIVSKSKSFFQA